MKAPDRERGFMKKPVNESASKVLRWEADSCKQDVTQSSLEEVLIHAVSLISLREK